MKRALLGIGVFLLLILLACERESKDFAGLEGPLPGSPVYSRHVDVSAVPALSHIASLIPQATEEKVIDGVALYTKNCAACHQANGKGIPGAFPPLDQSSYVVGDGVDVLAAIMIYGLIGPIEVLGVKYQSAMAGLGAALNDEELAAIASHIRSTWSNEASPVKAETFASVRKKWGSRGPLTMAELASETP